MKILLVEDDSIQSASLKNILSELVADSLIDTANTYADAVKLIKSSVIYDIFYLDISLNNENNNFDGLSIGEFIRTVPVYLNTPIVFVTSFTDKISFAVNKLHCYNYLVKPYTFEDVANSIRDIIGADLIKEKPISFKNVDGIIFKILPSEIIRICSDSKRILIFTEDYSFYTRFFTLDSILEILPKYFVRCHKKHIINAKMVSNYDKSTSIIHVNGTAIPIGRNYKSVFEEGLNKI